MPTQWTPQVIAAEKARKQAANIPLNYGKTPAGLKVENAKVQKEWQEFIDKAWNDGMKLLSQEENK